MLERPWQTQLESGEYASLEDLAKDVGCDRTYVGRMLRLTSLAPDVIEAILRGDEPDGLSLTPRGRVRSAKRESRGGKELPIELPAAAGGAGVLRSGPACSRSRAGRELSSHPAKRATTRAAGTRKE